ncbi:MAG: carotenoid biosynthesis protein [Lewinellaceae bacterium]|nr:carotenoid biosynthesis protein [Lewinellaceae bacterium]
MKERPAIVFLSLMYAAGVIGIHWNLHPGFILLTPLNLLASLVIALSFHGPWTGSLTRFLALSYVLGFAAELFGVQTGLLFGEYTYGKVLGPRIWGTPVMIGVNWMLVSYSAGMAVNATGPGWSWPVRALAGAGLLVALDLFIEPVAIEHGFWTWTEGVVPLRNYLGWFLVALPIQAFFAYHFSGQKNKVGAVLFILQFAFFLILGLL